MIVLKRIIFPKLCELIFGILTWKISLCEHLEKKNEGMPLALESKYLIKTNA